MVSKGKAGEEKKVADQKIRAQSPRLGHVR